MNSINVSDLQKLEGIIDEFIECFDKQEQLCQDGRCPAVRHYKPEIDLIKLEQVTREFVNDSGNISQEEVLKHAEYPIVLLGYDGLLILPGNTFLAGEERLVRNLRKLREKISDFVQYVNDHNGKLPANSQYHGEKDLMMLAKITHELFIEEDNFEFIDKEELPKQLPSTHVEVQNTSCTGRLCNDLGLS